MRKEAKNRIHRYDINRPRPRHGYKYTKYRISFSMMMVICIKQHLSNIWSSIYDKIKQHWGWVEKKKIVKRSVYSVQDILRLNNVNGDLKNWMAKIR